MEKILNKNMKQEFFNLKINTNGQKLYEFTDQTIEWIKKKKFKNGILNLSIQHTSASLIIQENADPDVQTDLLNYFLHTSLEKNHCLQEYFLIHLNKVFLL